MTMEAAALTDDAESTSPCRKLSHHTKSLLGIVAAAAVVAALSLLSVLVHSRRRRRSQQRQMCRDLQPGQEWALDEIVDSYDNDPFDFSLVEYSVGYFYSYKHQNTNETMGPKILVMLNSRYFHVTNAYSWGVMNPRDIGGSFFQLTIGNNSSGAVWAGLAPYEDGNITIDPSVVHIRLGSNATYKLYNDTVLLVSYRPRNQTLQVQQRDIDLSTVTLSKCGMKRLLEENDDLAAYYNKWKAFLSKR
jgi:hypothetical protein